MPPPKAKASKAKKAKKASVDLPAAPSPLDSLLTAHRTAVPSTLSSWKQRSDLLHLDLHLLHAPYLTLTFLLSTSSPLSCLLHRLHSVHGPFNGLRLFRSSSAESEDDELTDLSLTLEDLGCRGGTASSDEQQRTGESSSADAVTGVARRRYELWYTLLSALDGPMLMREPRQNVSQEQMDEARQRDDEQGDEDDDERLGIVVTAATRDAADEGGVIGGRSPEAVRSALERMSARARMGRVVEVAVDQHTSRQRVEQSKEVIAAAFDVNAQSQQLPSPKQPNSSRSNHASEAGNKVAAEEKQTPRATVAPAALSLALSYS